MSRENIKRNARMLKGHKNGLSYREIAKLYGIHPTTAWFIIKRLGNKAVDKQLA